MVDFSSIGCIHGQWHMPS